MPKDSSPTTETLSNMGRIVPQPIVTEMETSYLDYAMSVIVTRALPDARDGMKPVHRRILHSMNQLGLKHTAKFLKSARVVGDVLGKYHPHGDTAVYESMVRMAQDFSLRYPLIRGQGNFGSIDGDSAAAMRYTESKMERITEEMLMDIEKDTVDFRPNYDETQKEPTVLPAKIPQLLLNGTVGIAVGMATNIPPHNLQELVEAVLYLADNPKSEIDDLLKFIKGPDFPTGGIVYDRKVIKQAYMTGRGSVVMRGVAEIEEEKGKQRIRVSEIPYQVNKSTLITQMADLVQNKVIQGISDIRDESSSREGIRIIIELKKDSYPQKILNQLFKRTSLQTSFSYNMIALSDGLQPRLLNLKEMLEIFIKHRKTVIVRRVTFDRDRAKERAHILEGLKKALDNIDEVIQIIKKSQTKEIAKEQLIKKFKLTEIQTDAILQMRLQTLAGLERKKIDDELKEKKAFIAECETILKDPKRVVKIMKDELKEILEKYGDKRRTRVSASAVGEFSAKDTIPDAPMIVTLTRQGYVKRLLPQQFKAQHRGGKGIKGATTKEEDEMLAMLYASNHDDLLCFTNTGRVFTIPVYELPQGSRIAKGQAIVNLLALQPEEKITSIILKDLENKKYLLMATKNGVVKRTELTEFENIRRSGLIAQKIQKGDELKWVIATSGTDQIFILSKKGKAIRFPESNVRCMGRSAAGVRGIRLGGDDKVVTVAPVVVPDLSNLLVVMENGMSKMTKVTEYRLQSRGGTGVKAANITTKTGNIVGGFVMTGEEKGDIIIISKQGQTIRMGITDIPSRGRATQGVIIMRLKARDKVASMSLVLEEEAELDEKEVEKAKAKMAREEKAFAKALSPEEREAMEEEKKKAEEQKRLMEDKKKSKEPKKHPSKTPTKKPVKKTPAKATTKAKKITLKPKKKTTKKKVTPKPKKKILKKKASPKPKKKTPKKAPRKVAKPVKKGKKAKKKGSKRR